MAEVTTAEPAPTDQTPHAPTGEHSPAPTGQPSPAQAVQASGAPTELTAPGHLVHPADDPRSPWWRDAVIYQIYPRSWADADGDGIGDLAGITARLPYLKDLGVDAVWLSPFYVSPMNDAGYDVADYRDIDPIFGNLTDADRLIETAHALGLKVLVDLVPNHTSSEHAWFKAALAAAPGSPERQRYIFRDGQGPNGDLPPNNWRSVFGGQGWSRVPDPDGNPGQWYLHIFDTTQPDVNWDNEEVRAEYDAILRFWLDRGVDGFRVDVAHGLVKDPQLPDATGSMHTPENPIGHVMPMWDQEGVHEIYRRWRTILDSYTDPADPDSERILCAEAWVQPAERLARYVRPDEMHQAFNFPFLDTHWNARAYQVVIESSLRSNDSVGAPTTWVLSNHDVLRHASRFGIDQIGYRPNGIGADDPQPDAPLGLRRARAATALMLALPGGAYIYQGEELGLPEHTEMPDHFRQDPIWHRTKGTDEEHRGRDGCRVPMPWAKDAPSFGFGPGDHPWLPQPDAYASLAVDQQDGIPGSTLSLYRTLLALRHNLQLGHGSLTWDDATSPHVVAFRNASHDGARTTLVITNFGPAPLQLPTGTILLTSNPLNDDGTLPTDTTVWIDLS